MGNKLVIHSLTMERCGFDLKPMGLDTRVVDVYTGCTRLATAHDVNFFATVWESFRNQLRRF
jgi:hypothetical protein